MYVHCNCEKIFSTIFLTISLKYVLTVDRIITGFFNLIEKWILIDPKFELFIQFKTNDLFVLQCFVQTEGIDGTAEAESFYLENAGLFNI